MSLPERQASPGATAPAAQAVAGPEASPFTLPAPAGESRCGLIWEALFQQAAPQQRQELLGLARQQGLLYGHQLPPLTNGARAHADHARPSLTQFLQAPAGHLEPNRAAPVDFHDTDLDAAQKQAVALALSTPDLFLLSGGPGTGKTRVLAEVVTQAVARGERVLLLSASPAPVDRLLEQVADREGVWAVRCLGPHETAADLSPAARGLTLAERIRQFREEPLARALEGRRLAEHRCRGREEDQQRLAHLESLITEAERLAEEHQRLQRRRDDLANEVAEAATALEANPNLPASDLAAALVPLVRTHTHNLEIVDGKTAAARERLEAGRQRLLEQSKELETLQPLLEARTHRRLWTAAWWRGLGQGDMAGKCHTLEQQREQTRKEMHDLEDTIQALTHQREETLASYAAERAQRLDAEIQRRSVELDGPQRELDDRQAQLAQQWDELCGQLAADCPRPTVDRASLDAARLACQRLAERDSRELEFLTQWAAGLQQVAARADAHLPDHVNVVAATTTALPRDPHFGRRTDFDLLVLQEAHAVTESELLTVGARARRWVLVGELPRNAAPPAPARRPKQPILATSALRVGVFDRLWRRLHCESAQLPYVWRLEGGRLHCRLRAVPADQKPALEKESVADRPDIELCILTRPHHEPVLAEVLFPATMSIAQAKQYIYQEIQELAITPAGAALTWTEGADQVVLQLGKGRTADARAVDLEPGVREWVVGPSERGVGGWLTEALTFDRTAGWDRAQAEHWIQHLLGLRDTGRTVHLEVPYRMRPELAAVVADLLGDDGCTVQGLAAAAPGLPDDRTPSHRPASQPSCVRFLPVPPLGQETSSRRQPAGRPRLPRIGAGLELDLADSHGRDRLPSEVRSHLPARGLVNYLEAQAVVRTLEAWASHPSREHRANVLVLALYPAQAQLIQLLVDQSPALAAQRGQIGVTVPTAYSEREAEVVLLSLTRSHGHRAVSFGTDPEQLTLALTRARDELVLFGDPGTLVRRCQWEGPLDHLDTTAAARERALLERLVRLLEGRGPRREAFHVCEGAHA